MHGADPLDGVGPAPDPAEAVGPPPQLVAVVLALGLSTFGIGMSLTVVALVADDLAGSGIVVGAVVGARWVSRLLLNIPAGIAAERRGSWSVFLAGIVLVAVSGMLSALAGTWPLLLGARVVEGAGAAMSMTAGMAMIAATGASASRATLFGHFQLGQRIGFWLGPVAGGYVAAWGGERAALWAYAVIAAAAAVPLLIAGRPPLPGTVSGAASFRADLRTLLTNRPFLLVGLVTFVGFFTMTGLQFTAIPVLVDDQLGLGPEVVGWTVFASNAVSFVLVYPTAWASDRLSRRGTVAALLAIGGTGVLSMVWVVDVTTLLAAAAVTGAIHVLRGPATQAYAIDVGGAVSAGAASSLYRTLGDLGSAAGPFAVGWLLASGPETYFLVNAGLAGVVLIAFLVGTSSRPSTSLGAAT